MISNPKYGWCNFELGGFHGHPSDLTDVPVDLLKAVLDWWKQGWGCCFFDEEGGEFVLVLTPNSAYVIVEKDDTTIVTIPNINRREISAEIISDIEACLYNWCVEFMLDEVTDQLLQNRKEHIEKLLCELKECINGR